MTDADPPKLSQLRRNAHDASVKMVPRPVIEDQHETTATVTSLAVFSACPRKYYIQRSLGWNTGRFRPFDADQITESSAEEDNLSATKVGTAVHQILEGVAPSEDSPEARRLADVFVSSELGRRAAASPRKEHEWKFIADIDGTIVRGSIDVWFEENGELHIVDYKTGEPTGAQDYKPQLAFYAIALERALHVRSKIGLAAFFAPEHGCDVLDRRGRNHRGARPDRQSAQSSG